MVQYVCDWCKAVKEPEESWLLGFAAETVATTAARREVSLASSWDAARSAGPLAVHFCSMEHYEKYADALFGGTLPAETVIETEVAVPTFVKKKVVRTVGKAKKAKRKASSRRKSA